MNRSGYTDDGGDYSVWLYRKAVDSAIEGKRGQAFLRELRSALETMPSKRLAAGVVADAEGHCAMGAVALARGIPVDQLREHYEADETGELLGIAPSLAREIAYENDGDDYRPRTDEQRYAHMLDWTAAHIIDAPAESPSGHCGWCCRSFKLKRGRVGWHRHNGVKCPGAGGMPVKQPGTGS